MKFFGRRINAKGQEVPDPTPVELPLGYKHPPTLEERMKQMIRGAMSEYAVATGQETFDEANDFNVGEDDDGMFPDEDDQFAVNDPYLEEAAKRSKVENSAQLDQEDKKQGPGLDLRGEKGSDKGKSTPEKAHSST